LFNELFDRDATKGVRTFGGVSHFLEAGMTKIEGKLLRSGRTKLDLAVSVETTFIE